jgi:1,4-dihydroxy-6-naphthoate synthase
VVVLGHRRTIAAAVATIMPMSSDRIIELTIAHSPDPDDAFMWWPITGKIRPPENVHGEEIAHALGAPAIDTGRFRFRALAADIEVLNRRALERGDLEITAMSVRRWADVQSRYAMTTCGASFGDGFGPRLVARVTDARILCERCLVRPGVTIAIPGRGTTAFLMLGLLLQNLSRDVPDASQPSFIEVSFDQIIPAVVSGRADVGLVIHEGQISFLQIGLCMIADVGAWWKARTGLKLPLGINAVRRDLDDLYGPGTLAEISAILQKSVAYAMDRWEESVAYTLDFATANARRAGGEAGAVQTSLDQVDRYCRMYVTRETLDMGDEGREAIGRLLAEGASAGLCPAVGTIEAL